MDLNAIVESINRNGELESLCRRAAPVHWPDLMQEVNLILLTYKSPGTVVALHRNGELLIWLGTVIRNQARSKKGTFYRNYILKPRNHISLNDNGDRGGNRGH